MIWLSFSFIACHDNAQVTGPDWPDTGANFNPKISVVYKGELHPNGSEIHVTTAPAGIDIAFHMRLSLSNLSQDTLFLGSGQWLDNERFSISPPPPDELMPGESIALNIYTNPVNLSSEHQAFTTLSAPAGGLELFIVANTPKPLRMGLVGDGGFQLWSDDYGHSFTEQIVADTNSEISKSIAWGNGRFLFAGAKTGATSASGIWRHSDDGISWTDSLASDAFSASDCTYGLDRFACVREDVLSSSLDGSQIDHQPPLFEYKMNAIVALDDRFVAVGRGGRQAISFDGQNWDNESLSNEPDPYYDLATDGEILVAVGGVNRYHVSVSTDKGENWTDVPFGNCIGNSLEKIVFHNGFFMAQGTSDCHHNMNWSEDGLSWNPITALHPFERHHLLGGHNGWFFAWRETENGERFVTRSRDGEVWEAVHHLPSDISLKSMAVEKWETP